MRKNQTEKPAKKPRAAAPSGLKATSKTTAKPKRATKDRETSAAGSTSDLSPHQPMTAAARSLPDRSELEGFIPDPAKIHHAVPDDLAEYLGESFVESVTGSDSVAESQDQLVPEEIGGPFVGTDVRAVFAENISLAIDLDAEDRMDAMLDGEPIDGEDGDAAASPPILPPAYSPAQHASERYGRAVSAGTRERIFVPAK